MKYHFIVTKSLPKNILSSQLLPLIQALSEFEDCKLWLPQDYLYITTLNKVNVVSYKDILEIRTSIQKNDIIYIRDAFLYLKIKSLYILNRSVMLIYDFRGLLSYESFSRHKNILRFITIYIIEFFIYMTADKLFAVSINLKKKLYTIYKFKRNLNVVPCLSSRVIHNKNKIDSNCINFVYIGSMSKWQCIDQTLDLFYYIQSKINATLTIYTTNIDEAKTYMESYDFEENVRVDSLSHEELLKVLPDFDMGFLLRENLVLNKVASPVKFLEYTSSGVVPIVTLHVGDYSNDVKVKEIGIIYQDKTEELINEIKNISNSDIRKKLYMYSLSYNLSNYINNYIFKNDKL